MKYLKLFEEFDSTDQDRSDLSFADLFDLIKMGLADKRIFQSVLNLPLGGEPDEVDDTDDRIEGDIAAIQWLGFPERIVAYSFEPYEEDDVQAGIEKLGPISKLIKRLDRPDDDIYQFHIGDVDTQAMTPLYSYEGYRDHGRYFGAEVDGKRVVVLDAPDGPYFMFSPDDFSELEVSRSGQYTHEVIKQRSQDQQNSKLFENFRELPDFGTLRDFVNPENFADEDDDEAYQTSIDAAVITMETFGLDASTDPAAEELMSMGLGDRAGLIDLMPLDRVICVYNSNGLDNDTVPGLKRLVHLFPGLFAWDEEYDDLRFADEAVQTRVDRVGTDPYDAYNLMIYRDKIGTHAIEWSSYGWSAVFMLDSALPNK